MWDKCFSLSYENIYRRFKNWRTWSKQKTNEGETTLEQQRREIARVDVTHLENAAVEREKEDCSRLVHLATACALLRSFSPERLWTIVDRLASTFTLMHTIKHTYRAIEISRWFFALEYCEIEAVHKHNGIHRDWYKYVGQIGLFIKCEYHNFSLSYENI